MSCSLCATDAPVSFFAVTGGPDGAGCDICAACQTQIEGTLDADQMRGLATAMWSEITAVQVLAVRLLQRLKDLDWARDLIDQLWLDDETRAWVEAEPTASAHKDANGASLSVGDTVVLIKDLPVKGAGFTAKRGTAVRNISLVQDNPEHIEGRVEGQRIVILTQYVKRK